MAGNPAASRRRSRRGSARLVALLGVLVMPVALLVVAAPGSGGTTARKIVTLIDITGNPSGGNPSGGSGTFTIRSGAIADAGSMSYSFFGTPLKGSVTLTGKHGGLDLRLASRPSGLSVDSQGLDLWTGTWKIASGTGVFAGQTGLGAYLGIVGPSYKVRLHFEGFRT